MAEQKKRGRPKKAPAPPPKPLTEREINRVVQGMLALNDLVFILANAPKTCEVIGLFRQYESLQKKKGFVGSLTAADQQEMDRLHQELMRLDTEMRAKKLVWNGAIVALMKEKNDE